MESPLGGIGRGVNNAARGAVGGVDRLISAVEGLAEGIALDRARDEGHAPRHARR